MASNVIGHRYVVVCNTCEFTVQDSSYSYAANLGFAHGKENANHEVKVPS